MKGHLEYVATNTRILQPFFFTKCQECNTITSYTTVQVGKRSRKASIVLKAVFIVDYMNTPLPLKLFKKKSSSSTSFFIVFLKKSQHHILIQDNTGSLILL